MNRERLTILRDHLASIPDERFDIRLLVGDAKGREVSELGTTPAMLKRCGTSACVAGWANALFAPKTEAADADTAMKRLGLTARQRNALFLPYGYSRDDNHYTRAAAVVAIQSMLDSSDDAALPVWPAPAEASS